MSITFPVSAGSGSNTGTSGACRRSAWRISSRSAPIKMAALSRLLPKPTSSSKDAPFANPPAIQMIDSNAAREACAACGLVAFESSIQVTLVVAPAPAPAPPATTAIRCASGVKPRRPARTAEAGTP